MKTKMWPKGKIVLSALRGMRTVFKTSKGINAAGVPSDIPHVFMLHDGVYCEACSVKAPFPEAPCGQGDAMGARTPLFDKNTLLYANYLLTSTLHPFAKAHAHEQPQAA